MKKSALSILAVLILGGAIIPNAMAHHGIHANPQSEDELVELLLIYNHHGETVDTGEGYRVEVVNTFPVFHESELVSELVDFSSGDTCVIGRFNRTDGTVVEGGTIQVRGRVGSRVIYEYTARGNSVDDWLSCPSGVLFFES